MVSFAGLKSIVQKAELVHGPTFRYSKISNVFTESFTKKAFFLNEKVYNYNYIYYIHILFSLYTYIYTLGGVVC